MSSQPDDDKFSTDIHILPELSLDLAEGKTDPDRLGKTTIPTVVLPEIELELRPVDCIPALQLRLSPRAGATPTQVALDLFRIFTTLNQLDQDQQGSGLQPFDARPTNGKLTVILKATSGTDVRQRLRKLMETVNASQKAGDGQLVYPSIECCEATLVAVAA